MADDTPECPKCRSGFTCDEHRQKPPMTLQERQQRLLEWILDPQGDDICRKPEHLHDWTNARWRAAELVERTGLYDGRIARRACLADLHALQRAGKVTTWGNGAGLRWSREWQ